MKHSKPRHPLARKEAFRHRFRAKRHAAAIAQRLEQELPILPEEAIESPFPGVKPLEHEHSMAEDLHDWILGGQDGLVNVLGSILGVAIVTTNRTIILVAGLAALFAESISMAAVAYTSVKASHSYYHSQREATRKAIEENPVLQREILIDIYVRKGLSRADAHRVITELTRDKDIWLQTLMEEHLRIYQPEETGPLHSAWIVGVASFIGSMIPLVPFFFLTGSAAIIVSCITSVIALFAAGAAAAVLTIGDWRKRGLEMAMIGATAAAVSFLIGFVFAKGIIPS
jgi:vacuolar iron transporter family protein